MTILETIPIIEQTGKYIPMMVWSALIAILCLFIATLLFKEYDMGGIIFTISAGITMLVFIVSLILTIAEPPTDTGRVKYIVKVDESYPLNEFYDKYKVLEHTKYTNVYTVEEIND